MRCSNCGADNPSGKKFCSQCGRKYTLVCPQCDTKCLPDDKYCGECGAELITAELSIPVDYSKPQSYTPKHLIEKILTTRSAIEGERKLVTVFFADVAGFTSMSEKLDPEEVHQVMDGCFKILMEEIHNYEGTINQFTGDGVMALFGAPLALEGHAQRACHAALSVQQSMDSYSERLQKDFGIAFRVRIGINSGPVIVGAIGDDLRMDYTAVGDTTNLAARIESKSLPGTVLVSENTHHIVQDFFEFRELGSVEIKGKSHPQKVFQLLKTGTVLTRIGASAVKGLTRFVGRKKSLPELAECYEKVTKGSGQVVGIVGEAGVGKSRVLLEFKNQLPYGECIHLEGRCVQYGNTIMYKPILDIIKSYFEIQDGDLELDIKNKIHKKTLDIDDELASIISPIQEILSLKVDDHRYTNLEPKKRREKTFEALRNLFLRTSRNNLIVIAIEDLHWIDRSSKEFLDYLIGWLTNSRILVILLYRPVFTHKWDNKSYYSRIGLTQLGTESSTELIRAILEEGEVDFDLKALILRRAEGNPLFIEEFTISLMENGYIQKIDDTYVLYQNDSDISIPDTIQGIIAARMDRLEDNLKRTMQIASVIGRNFAFRVLQSITDLKEELESYLFNLQRLEFICEKNILPELEYIFKHGLIQEVAYNSLLVQKRKMIHTRIGIAIEKLHADRLEEFYELLAYHFSKSDRPEKAITYAKLAGDKATGNHALCEAFIFYKDAIDILDKNKDIIKTKPNRLNILDSMITPMRLLSYPDGSVQILEVGEALASMANDGKRVALMRNELGVFHVTRANIINANQHFEEAFKVSKVEHDDDLLVSAGMELVFSCFTLGEITRGIDVARQVIALIEETDRQQDNFNTPFTVFTCICAINGYLLGQSGDTRRGLLWCQKGLVNAKNGNDLRSLLQSQLWTGMLYIEIGDADSAKGFLLKSVALAEKLNWTISLATCWGYLSRVDHLIGDFERAEHHAKKGLNIHTNAGIKVGLSHYFWDLGIIATDKADFDNAWSNLEKAEYLSNKYSERGIFGAIQIYKGRCLGKKENIKSKKTENYFLEGIEICQKLKHRVYSVWGYTTLGEYFIDTGQNERAITSLKKAENMAEGNGMKYWVNKARSLLSKV